MTAPSINVNGVTFVYENIIHSAIAMINNVTNVIIFSACINNDEDITIYQFLVF